MARSRSTCSSSDACSSSGPRRRPCRIGNEPQDFHLSPHEVESKAIADKLFRDGRYAESLEILREVLTTLQELARTRPADATLLHDVASVHAWMARVSQARQDFAAALAERRESLWILAELSGAHPHNGRFQNDLCTAYERCCFVLQQLGRDEEALEHCRKALDIIKNLAAAEPRNPIVNANLRSSYCRVGELELAMGRTDAALGRFEMFRQVADAAVETFPDNVQVRRELAVSYYKMAELHQVRAKDENIGPRQRSSHWREAAIQLGKARDVFVDMDKRGILSQSDAGVPDELAAEIAQCESEIRKLEEETTSESDG